MDSESMRDKDVGKHSRGPKRKRLSIDEKYQICKRLEEGESVMSVSRIYDIKKNSIWRIKREASSLKNFVENVRVGDHRVRKTIKAPQNQLLEHGIFAWFIRRQLAKEQVSGTLLSDKALSLNKKIGGAADFAASSGWLHRFKLRHQITFQNLIGGEMVVESLSALDSRCLIKETIERENYDENNIYHLEEAELTWKNFPRIEAEWVKSRLTIVICHNSAGSHRLPLLLLGKDDCGAISSDVVYKKRKVRSNTQIMHWYENHFISSVKEFQSKLGREGKVLLIIDRCTTEAAVEHLNTVDKNFHVLLLPYKTAAIAQPLDRYIVTNIKCSYRMRFLKHLVSDGDVKLSCENFQLDSCLHMLSEIWNGVTGEEMRSSWNSLWYVGDSDIVSDLYFSPHVTDFLSIIDCIPGYENFTETDMYAWLNVDNGRELLLEGEEQSIFDHEDVQFGTFDPLSDMTCEEMSSKSTVDQENTVDVDHTQLGSCVASNMSAASDNRKPDTKRMRLSLEEKYAICRRLGEGESLPSLKKDYNLKHNTLLQIIQNASRIKKFVETRGVSDERVRKAMTQPQNQRVENGVLAWFIRKQLMKQSVSWSSLCDAAVVINIKMGGNLHFYASSGWLRGFKLRHQIKGQNLQCTELLCESSSAVDNREIIKNITHDGDYTKENIYLVERTEFAWKMLPRCETTGTDIRLTLNLCTNSTGTHKLPILVLGKEDCQEDIESIIYKKHLSKNHTHVVDWYRDVLVTHIKEFQVKSGVNNKVLIIMDRTITEEFVDQLNNFDKKFNVVLIPPKTASAVQPLDRSIILNMKCSYRMSLLQQILSHNENSQSIIEAYENFELDDGLQLLSEAWDSLTNEEIETAWKKLWFVGEADITDDIDFSPSILEFKSVLQSVPGHDDCSEFDVRVWLNIDNDLNFVDAEELTSSLKQDFLPDTNNQAQETGSAKHVQGKISETNGSPSTAGTVANKSLEEVLNVEGMKKRMFAEMRKRAHNDLGTENSYLHSQPSSEAQGAYRCYEFIANNLVDVKIEPKEIDTPDSEDVPFEEVTSDIGVYHDREKQTAVHSLASETPGILKEGGQPFKMSRNREKEGANAWRTPSNHEALEACETLLQWISRHNIKRELSLDELHSVILSKAPK